MIRVQVAADQPQAAEACIDPRGRDGGNQGATDSGSPWPKGSTTPATSQPGWSAMAIA